MVKHNMHKLSDDERNLLRHYAEGERRRRSPTNACSPAPSRHWPYRGATEARAKCAPWRDGCRSKSVERRGCDSRVTPVGGASNTAAALTAPASWQGSLASGATRARCSKRANCWLRFTGGSRRVRHARSEGGEGVAGGVGLITHPNERNVCGADSSTLSAYRFRFLPEGADHHAR